MKLKILLAVGVGCLCIGALADASQTVTYNYDALGRLIGTQTQGGTGNGTTQILQYDAAGNRTEYQTLMQVALSMNSPTVNLTPTGATLRVNLSNPAATGTVTFTENGQTIGVANVSKGQASVIVQNLSKGTQTITAFYSGDSADASQTTIFTVNIQNLSWLPAVLDLLLH